MAQKHRPSRLIDGTRQLVSRRAEASEWQALSVHELICEQGKPATPGISERFLLKTRDEVMIL